MSIDAFRGQRRVSDLLKLEFQVIVTCPTCVLTSEFRSSGKLVVVLSH